MLKYPHFVLSCLISQVEQMLYQMYSVTKNTLATTLTQEKNILPHSELGTGAFFLYMFEHVS